VLGIQVQTRAASILQQTTKFSVKQVVISWKYYFCNIKNL